MKRYLIAVSLLVALSAPQPAAATTTWTPVSVTLANPYRSSRSAQAVCTTGSEAAPSGATAGMSLSGVRGFLVLVEAVTDGATVAGGKLLAYLYNEVTGRWLPIPDLDLTMPAAAAQGYAFLGPSPAIGQPVVAGAWGRIAYVPSSMTISAGSASVKLLATGTGGDQL
jgi:hypothetical protein